MLAADAYAAVAKLAEGSIATLTADTRETSSHTWNAVGTLVGNGAEKNAVILLSAHLDHLGGRDTGVDRIYNGADDDASGSIAVLALAEALAKGKPLQRSVVFAWFGSEEVGGYGARYFVEKPIVPLDRIVANPSSNDWPARGRGHCSGWTNQLVSWLAASSQRISGPKSISSCDPTTSPWHAAV
jgi:Zn-dependent M28 family amino/carboxypeptidase